MNRDPALEEAILHPELRHIHFFNGRLLTGDDLAAEQNVQHAHGRHLGLAIGSGVAQGLVVTSATDSPPSPVLVISAGLAVNRFGQTLRLECDQRVALVIPPDPAATDQCVFNDCGLRTPGGTLASGTGYHVLTIAPASLPEGKAPVSGLGSGVAICNSRFLAEGVKFRVFRLNLTLDNTDRARNLLSQACFGLTPGVASGPWPDALPARYGWETLMPPAFSADFDVPLAVLEWNSSGLGLLKLWPVRRRLAQPAATIDWAWFCSDRRVSEGEALFLDFQDDLKALLVTDPAIRTGGADRWFAMLPPAGVLPSTITWQTFLGPLGPVEVTPLDAALWGARIRESFAVEPIYVPDFADAVDAQSNGTILPALAVYQVPERNEVLFARAPFGRLRIFFDENVSAQLALVFLRLADGSSRFAAHGLTELIDSEFTTGLIESETFRALGNPEAFRAKMERFADLLSPEQGGALIFDEVPAGETIVLFIQIPVGEDGDYRAVFRTMTTDFEGEGDVERISGFRLGRYGSLSQFVQLETVSVVNGRISDLVLHLPEINRGPIL